MTKTCKICLETKPATSEFWHKGKRGVGGFLARCKLCVCAIGSDRRLQTGGERNRKLHSKYGINTDIYNEMLASQNGCCAICHTTKMGRNRLYFSVDHCHTTGKVRGLVCILCNNLVGLLECIDGTPEDTATAALNYINKAKD